MALAGAEIWDQAIRAGVNLAMEASVAGGIPIHTVLREGISGDRIVAIAGILNGTSNYILTEMERRGESFDTILAEAQALGYAEANPSADVDGFDARSKLAILSALAFGERITPSDIFVEGIRRITAQDFDYAHQLGHTIRLVCSGAADRARARSLGPPRAHPSGHDPRWRARRVQRHLGERANMAPTRFTTDAARAPTRPALRW